MAAVAGAALGPGDAALPVVQPRKGFRPLPPTLTPGTRGTIVTSIVAAHAALRADADALARWRKRPEGARPLAPALLKHADDQTVPGIGAVLRAIDQCGWAERSFADWGAVAGSNFFGRAGIAQTVQRYAQEGPWGVSPHLIPQQSLHAAAGTVSLVLGIHGPNFGVGGGPDAAPDAFLLAAALLADGRLPGLWLLLTGHEREFVPGEIGAAAPDSPQCLAVALALVPETAGPAGLRLRIDPFADRDDGSAAPEFRLSEWVDAQLPHGAWRLGGAGRIELVSSAAEGDRP